VHAWSPREAVLELGSLSPLLQALTKSKAQQLTWVRSVVALNWLATVWAAQNLVLADGPRLSSASQEGFAALAELPWLLISLWYPSQLFKAAVQT